jgi:hypothetical protein
MGKTIPTSSSLFLASALLFQEDTHQPNHRKSLEEVHWGDLSTLPKSFIDLG